MATCATKDEERVTKRVDYCCVTLGNGNGRLHKNSESESYHLSSYLYFLLGGMNIWPSKDKKHASYAQSLPDNLT